MLILSLGIGLGLYITNLVLGEDPGASEGNEQEQEEEKATQEAETNVNEFIEERHERWNELVLHGHINVFHTGLVRGLEDNIEKARSYYEEIGSEDLQKDLKNIINHKEKLNSNDLDEEEEQDIAKKLHRLYHDLDIHRNGYSDHTIYGVTHYEDDDIEVDDEYE